MAEKLFKTFSADTQQELDTLIKGASSNIIRPSAQSSTGHQLSLEQRVINLEGQTKVLYDRLDALKTATSVPQSLLDDIKDMKTEIEKNIDSLTQAHLDMNEFLKNHPSDTEIDAKMRILNNLITENKASQSKAMTLINTNKSLLDTLKKGIITSNYRQIYRIMKDTSPSINVTDDILYFSKAGDMLTLEMDIPDEASDNEIVINEADPYPFYIPEYANASDPLRARLKANGLDIQVHGSNAKVIIYCTADPANIGHFEWRTKWNTGSFS